MPLSREFVDTIKKRADESKAFRVGLLRDAASAFVSGSPDTCRSILSDYVKATIGFEELARQLDMTSSSVKRMLGPKGNPKSSNFAAIMGVLQRNEEVVLRVVERSDYGHRKREPT
ncbi:MAG: transcriptional regulator [Planctomycetota bacterium]